MNGATDTPLAQTAVGEVASTVEAARVAGAGGTSTAGPPREYWHADGLVDRVRGEFEAAHRDGEIAGLRECFYLLAEYHARTIAILGYALGHRREPLTQASLRNLMAIHRALHLMHRVEPDVVPEALTVGRDIRRRLFDDMIVRVLRDSPEPLDVATITRRVNDLDVLADATEATISRHLASLVSSGNARSRGDGFALTSRAYHTVNLDQAVLAALLGPTVAPRLERAGFRGARAGRLRRRRALQPAGRRESWPELRRAGEQVLAHLRALGR
jgi:hypothetical protein